ncbi:TPM domain-containing protein [Chitinophaga pendula]|uniref:TPM domain-containing protein n=1 Tax=Chitinophaga TaxID=79328 RepID=UPI000BAF4D06|nr:MULTISPECIES: TPM domain-containing protein [Chitinophaga]ASZ14493.1 hypothetical protein CK934_27880 [Chitinophaga sp. MD30]UCJ07850.1 TPM domain-containing protein [Chitinophaga pendula]
MIKLICSLTFFVLSFQDVNYLSDANSTFVTVDVPDTIPKQLLYLSDRAHVFNQAEQRTLDSLLHYYDQHDTVKMIVFTLDSSMTTKERFDDTVNGIREKWAMASGTEEGIGIGFSKDLRKIRISVGRGIVYRFPDEAAQHVIDGSFIPAFKQGKYYEGFIIGLRDIVQKVHR